MLLPEHSLFPGSHCECLCHCPKCIEFSLLFGSFGTNTALWGAGKMTGPGSASGVGVGAVLKAKPWWLRRDRGWLLP